MRIILTIFTLFYSFLLFAQTAPVKGKGQAQATYQTIERLETPNSGVTVTADKAVLLEGDPENLLVNPGFEHQTFGTGWTVNNGTATVDTTNFYDGKKSMSISLSAVNGDILTQCVTPTGQKGGTNMAHSLRVKTTLSNLQVCSVLGSTEQQCVSASNIDSFVEILATSVATNGSALCVKLKSTSSATGTVKVDSGYIGKNRNIGTVTQASFYGSLSYAATANCNWPSTSTSFVVPSADTDCPSPTVAGSVAAPGTKVPSVVANNLPPGEYMVVVKTVLLKSGTVDSLVSARISDGTTSDSAQQTYAGTTNGAYYPVTLVGRFSYTSAQSSITFSVQTATGNAANTVQLWAQDVSLDFKIYRFPVAEQQAVSSSCIGTADCENLFSARVSSADAVSNENVDWINGNCTSGTTGRATCIFNTNLFSVAPNCLAVVATSTSINQLTCSLGGDANTAQVTVDCKSDASDSNQPFDLFCQRVGSDRKPGLSAPLLIGSVTSSSTGAERIERFKGVCSTSSSLTSTSIPGASIANQVSSCCDITLPAAYAFKSTSETACVVSRENATAPTTYFGSTFFSTTGITVCASSGSNSSFNLVCTGPK